MTTNPNITGAIVDAIEAFTEIVQISDRNHDAWNKGKQALKKLEALKDAVPDGLDVAQHKISQMYFEPQEAAPVHFVQQYAKLLQQSITTKEG